MQYIYSSISIFGMIMFLSVFTNKSKSKKTRNALKELNNIGNNDYDLSLEGMKIFRSIRYLIKKYTTIESNLSNLEKKLASSGIYKYINYLDFFIIKVALFVIYMIFYIRWALPLLQTFTLEQFFAEYGLQMTFYNLGAFLIFWFDQFVLSMIIKQKEREIYKNLVSFIALFDSSIASGNNLYYSLLYSATDLGGRLDSTTHKYKNNTLANAIIECCKEFSTLGQERALIRLKNTLNIEDIDTFINLIIAGQKNNNADFGSYIKEHSKELITLRSDAKKEANESIPIYMTFANGIGILCFSVLVFRFINYYIASLQNF